MKNMLSVLLVSCISVFLIAGCGSEPAPKGAPPEKSGAKQTEIKTNAPSPAQTPRANTGEAQSGSTSGTFVSYEGKEIRGTISGTDAVIMGKPGADAKAIGVLNNNEPVYVTGKQGEWFRIRRIETVQRGWVHGKFLRLQ